MEIRGLGYMGVGTSDLSDWTTFATNWLGMQMIERGNTARAFRMDDRAQRLVVDRSLAEGERYFGFEVADAAALQSLAGKLEAAGVAVRLEAKSLADQRFVKELISFDDPGGNHLEAFYGAAIADEPFRPGRSISGFRTGALGMGHVVFHVKNIDDLLGFYTDLLGFGVTDYITTPFRAYFMHINPRHHSVALIETGKQDLHHLMVELFSLDDVGQGYDIALGRSGEDRHNAGPAPQRRGYVVLPSLAGRVHAGIRVGRQGRNAGRLDSDGGHSRAEPLGARSGMAAGGAIPAGARYATEGRGRRHAAAAARDRRQLRPPNGVCPWWDAATGRG